MKNKSITIRLDTEDITLLNNLSTNNHMTNSEYIRFLITSNNHVQPVQNQNITKALCNLYIKLEQLGISEEKVGKEIRELCQML